MKIKYKINAITLIIAFLIILTNPIFPIDRIFVADKTSNTKQSFIVRPNANLLINKEQKVNVQKLEEYNPVKINYLSSNIIKQDVIKTEVKKESIIENINKQDTEIKVNKETIDSNKTTVKEENKVTNKPNTVEVNKNETDTKKQDVVANKNNTSNNKKKQQVLNKTNISKNNKVESNKSTTNKKNSYTKNEAYELAKIIMCEAEGEPQKCKEYVGQVVLNRVKSDRFPNTIHGVIFQKNQFTPTSNGRWNKKEPNQACWDAAYKVLNASEPLTDALFFEACKGSSWHSRNLTKVAHVGRTRFYKY